MGVCLQWMRPVKAYLKHTRPLSKNQTGLGLYRRRPVRRNLSCRKYTWRWIAYEGEDMKGYRMNGGGVGHRPHASYLWATVFAIEFAVEKGVSSLVSVTEEQRIRRWATGMTWEANQEENHENPVTKPVGWDIEAERKAFPADGSEMIRACHHYVFFHDWASVGIRDSEHVKLVAKWFNLIAKPENFIATKNPGVTIGLAPYNDFIDEDYDFAVEMRDYFSGAASRGFAVMEE